jgi:hypothetical protein
VALAPELHALQLMALTGLLLHISEALPTSSQHSHVDFWLEICSHAPKSRPLLGINARYGGGVTPEIDKLPLLTSIRPSFHPSESLPTF